MSPRTVPAGERLPRGARIRSGAEIRGAMRRGRRAACGPVDAWVVDSPAGRARLGVVVPRFGRSVADRNRLQRRLREILRREWLPAAVRCGDRSDLVVRARPAAYEASFRKLREALLEGLESPCSES